MKLYLSSYRIPTPEDLFALLSKKPEDCRTGIIVNAKDSRPAEEKVTKLYALADDLGKIGLKSSFIDLHTLKNPTDDLHGFDVLYAAGGDTFALRSAMKRSGFDQAIRGLLRNGLVYVGESAGAIVAGATLKGFELADTPSVIEEVIWDGMGLVDRIIVPHANNPDYADRMPHIVKQYQDDPRLTLLNDNQALVIDSNTLRLVTNRSV